MNNKRLIKLQQYAHDTAIELKTSYKNGKIIASSRSLGDVCTLIEELIKACLATEPG